jgi:hypothetical protein
MRSLEEEARKALSKAANYLASYEIAENRFRSFINILSF